MATSLGTDEYAEPDVSTTDPVDKKPPAFRGLKQYVRDLDANTLPPFLARLCAADRPSSSYSEEEMLCIFETAAEVHGRSIVPHVGQIVSAVVRIMASGSSPSRRAGCSKVVCTLSRYCIDPLGREEERSETMSSLCRPLSDCLMHANKSVSSGSALCIAALVQSSSWQFASNELVNDVCLKVSGALEEEEEEARCQTAAAAHVSLVLALVKHSPLTLEPYGRSLIKSGLQVLDRSSTNKASSSQMILSSIQMVHSIMMSVNVRTISSEIGSVIHALEHCQDDGSAPDICAAASQAAETAKILLLGRRQEERGARRNVSPLGNCSGGNSRKGGSNSPVDRAGVGDSGSSGSPRESQPVRGFNGFFNSPLQGGQQCTGGVLGATRARRRRLWSCGSEFSHGMSSDERFHTWAPDYVDTLGVTAQSDSADLVKSSRRRSDVLTRIGDPCPTCLTPRATNQVCRRQALSAPRKQVQSLTYCSDSERDGHHRLPPRSALRFTDHPSFQKNSGCEERKGCRNSTQQRRNQPRTRTADSLAEDLKFPTSSSRRCDSARAPPPPCEERRCDDAAERHPRVIGIAKRRETNRRRSTARFFICAMVVFAAALLLACWKQDYPSHEMYFVPT